MIDANNIEELRFHTETQLFDRKSARIDPKALANLIIAFANADGGDAAIGIEDDGTITGIDSQDKRINELLRAPLDYCIPSVSVNSEVVACTDAKGQPNHILIMHVFPSPQVHANQADEVYMRVGDKSKKLNFDQRLQLLYSKGTRFFEDTPVPNATIDDIDLDFVAAYRLSSCKDAAAVPQWTLPADEHRHTRSGSAWPLSHPPAPRHWNGQTQRSARNRGRYP